MAFTSASVTPSSQVGRAITWTMPGLNVGASTTVTVVVTVDAAAAEWTRTNFAGLAPFDADPVTANNTASQDTSVVRQIDLSVTKTPLSLAVAGTTLTYTLAVTNEGTSQATGVVLSDTIPVSTTFAWASSAPSSNVGRNLAWSLPDLSPGASLTVSLAITIDQAASGTLVNQAGVVATETDVDADNNLATASTPVSQQSDLTLAGSTASSTVSAGHLISYTLVVSNTGPSRATGVMLSDTCPPAPPSPTPAAAMRSSARR